MMQVIPQWRVTVVFSDRVIVFGVSDPYLSNVLRKVADLDFGKQPMEQPTSLTVSSAK